MVTVLDYCSKLFGLWNSLYSLLAEQFLGKLQAEITLCEAEMKFDRAKHVRFSMLGGGFIY
jgi:hypothetical protein